MQLKYTRLTILSQIEIIKDPIPESTQSQREILVKAPIHRMGYSKRPFNNIARDTSEDWSHRCIRSDLTAGILTRAVATALWRVVEVQIVIEKTT